MYAWVGPFVGALIRPVGGWIADKVGGAKATQIVSIAALGVAYFMAAAYRSATPGELIRRLAHGGPPPMTNRPTAMAAASDYEENSRNACKLPRENVYANIRGDEL